MDEFWQSKQKQIFDIDFLSILQPRNIKILKLTCKQVFLKTIEFIRNFEYENTDYSRKMRLVLAHDPNQLVLHVAGFGDLNVSTPFGVSGGGLQPPAPGLLRSKSDHRLALRNLDYLEEDEPPRGGRSKYSRFRRRNTGEEEDDTETRGVRFKEERERPLDTEDVTKGPLSGITRLADSPRVMKKLQENPTGRKEKKEKKVVVPPPPEPVVARRAAPPAARQVSEEDEIAKIKRLNKGATTSAVEEVPPVEERVRRTPAPEVSVGGRGPRPLTQLTGFYNNILIFSKFTEGFTFSKWGGGAKRRALNER